MPRAERLAVLGLLVAMAASAVTLFVLSRDLSFWSDELDWLTVGEDFAPETLLTPHNSHLIGVPRVIYEAFPRLFDAGYVPFRLVSIAAVLACAALFFILARRRVGGPMALAPTLVLLFFGSSSEVVISPLGLPISLSIAFGLATFVALERETRAADVAAAILLALSILSDTFGTIIAGGVFLYLLFDPSRRRRIWVGVIPLLLYVAWWLWAQKFDQDIAAASNLAGVPAFVLESAAATLGAITGIGKSFGSGSDALETVVQVALIAIAIAGTVVLVLRARRVGGGPARANLLTFALTLLAFWVAIALSENEARQPSTPRYLLFAAIMVFLILAEAYRGERLNGRSLTIFVAVFAACLGGNVARLIYNGDGLTERADVVRTQLAMIELAGGEENPGFRPQAEGPPGSPDIVAPAAELNDFTDRYGSLGFSLDEVRGQPAAIREDADFVLARALNMLPLPVDESVQEATTGCEDVTGSPEDPTRFELLEGTTLLRAQAEGEGEPLVLGRFGEEPTVGIGVGELPSGTPLAVVLSPDAASEPWFADVSAPLEVCELPPVAEE